jgi:hypothetical protein
MSVWKRRTSALLFDQLLLQFLSDAAPPSPTRNANTDGLSPNSLARSQPSRFRIPKRRKPVQEISVALCERSGRFRIVGFQSQNLRSQIFAPEKFSKIESGSHIWDSYGVRPWETHPPMYNNPKDGYPFLKNTVVFAGGV